MKNRNKMLYSAQMKSAAKQDAAKMPSVGRGTWCLAGMLGVSLLLFAGYGAFMVSEAPVEPEETLPLDPEETVLYYRPAELEYTTPLVEQPTEFEDFDSESRMA